MPKSEPKFFWINNSGSLFVTNDKEAVKDQFNPTLWADFLESNYTTQLFEQNFPSIAGRNYASYKPTAYEEDQQEDSKTSKPTQ